MLNMLKEHAIVTETGFNLFKSTVSSLLNCRPKIPHVAGSVTWHYFALSFWSVPQVSAQICCQEVKDQAISSLQMM